MKRKLLFLGFAVTIISVCVIALLLVNNGQNNTNSSGKLLIKDYNSEGNCAALMPSCGYCPGEETNGDCYVTQAEFDAYKAQYSDLEATD